MTAEPAATSPSTPALMEVADLAKRFPAGGRRTVHAVNGVSFDVAPGEILSLVGESGCGKTTTGRMLVGLHVPSAGSIRFDGREVAGLRGRSLRALRRRAQMVFQDPYSSLNPRKTVGAIVAEPLRNFGLARRAERRERVAETLHAVGLEPEHAARYPHEFSGGQRQRIGIARALVVEPAMLVCDEPVSALDVSVQAQVVNLLRRLSDQRGLALVMIAHDLAVVRYMSTRVAVMYLGRIVEIGPKQAIFAEPRHPYTRALIASIPNPDPDVPRPRVAISGEPPSPADIPAGCAFHTRCPYAVERCRSQAVALVPVEAGRRVACHRADEIPDLAGRDP